MDSVGSLSPKRQDTRVSQTTVDASSGPASSGSTSSMGCAGFAGMLKPGTKCRYHSQSWAAWMPAVVVGFNPREGGTYDLDVRPHAKLENISPLADASAAEAW